VEAGPRDRCDRRAGLDKLDRGGGDLTKAPFIPAAAPLALYAKGDAAAAADLADRVLEGDPNAAEAHLCHALIRLRAGDTAAMVQSLRHCVRARSADWLLGRLRDDFHKRGLPRIAPAHAFRLGAFLRSALSSLGPVLPPEQRRADHPFVNVVGTSYVRSFGANTALFPLFIGMGPTMLLLTEEASALTRRKFAENLRRVDASRDTLLVIGGDAFYHHRNILKTRTEPDAATPNQADRDLMKRVAERHDGIFADARKLLKGRLFMLGSTPTFSEFVDDLALELNGHLSAVCALHGVKLIDPWAQLADPATNRLREDFSANAYPGDIHYSLATVPIFLDALKLEGALPPEVRSEADFEWTSVFDCEVDKAERTRIWSEPSVSPNNAFKSDKIASSHIAGGIADLTAFFLSAQPDMTIAMINVRDGAAVTLVPPSLLAGVVALTDTEQNRRAAQMTLDFYGRSDVRLHDFGPEALAAISDTAFAALVLLVHPDTAAEDERRCNAVLARAGAVRVLVAIPDPSRLRNLNLGERKFGGPWNISNRHIPEKWRNYAVYLSA
jgi:hypothetical protein